ncbi:MAG: hypothetical protein EBT05_15450 [Betaproteobacteria bacterium]|nr:hypothetical protein [Betaproteobacteria bacterium]
MSRLACPVGSYPRNSCTLTTVRTPRVKIGEAAATLLAGLIRGEVQREPLVDLGFEIVERDST